MGRSHTCFLRATRPKNNSGRFLDCINCFVSFCFSSAILMLAIGVWWSPVCGWVAHHSLLFAIQFLKFTSLFSNTDSRPSQQCAILAGGWISSSRKWLWAPLVSSSPEQQQFPQMKDIFPQHVVPSQKQLLSPQPICQAQRNQDSWLCSTRKL